MKLVSSLLLVLLTLTSNAGSLSVKPTEDSPKKASRRENVEKIESNFALRPTYTIQSNWLRITPKGHGGSIFNYQPNVIGSAGGMIKIKGVVVSYQHKLPTSEERNKRFGETDYRNIDLNIQARIVGFNFNYQDYLGFYYNPTQNFEFITSESDTVIQRPDLQYYTGGLQMHFVFTPSFSINAAFAQTERQKKSAGSFMMLIGDRFTQYQMDSTMVPNHLRSEYYKLSKMTRGSFNTTYMALGMGYSFIKGKFSVTPIVLFGAGLQIQSYNQGFFRQVGVKLPYYFTFKNAIGYNGDHFFTRVISKIEIDNTRLRDSKIGMYYLAGEFSIGVRF